MSLVNDMLRDLDARRRDAPTGTVGTERLVPAVESDRRRQLVPANIWLMLALLVSILLLATFHFSLNSGAPRTFSVTVPTASVATPAAESLVPELDRLNRRMQELEATNRKLQEEALPAQAPVSVQGPADGQAAIPAQEITPAWTPREWQSETELSSQQTQRAMPAAVQQRAIEVNAGQPLTKAAPAVATMPRTDESTLVRSPRELTLSERDRLRVQQSLELWQKGQQAAALASLQDYLADEPRAHQSREILAKLLLQQGDSLSAKEVVDAGLQLSPSHTGFRKISARVLLAAGLPGEAAGLLEAAAPSVAADTEYHDLLATALLSSKRFSDAALSYQSLVQIDQQQARWWYGLAAAQDGAGRSYEAAQAYEQALKLGNLSTALRQASQQRIASIRQN